MDMDSGDNSNEIMLRYVKIASLVKPVHGDGYRDYIESSHRNSVLPIPYFRNREENCLTTLVSVPVPVLLTLVPVPVLPVLVQIP